MIGALKFFGVCIIAGVAGGLVTVLLHVAHTPAVPAVDDLSYSDFLSITLTSLAIMITVLGFFVAAAGVIGWSTLENKLRSHSIEYFAKQLEKEGPLRRELEELFADIAYTGIEGLKEPRTDETPYDD